MTSEYPELRSLPRYGKHAMTPRYPHAALPDTATAGPGPGPAGVTSSRLARRGVLLSAPVLLLTGCGMLPIGAGASDGDADAEGASADGSSQEGEADARSATTATLEIMPTPIEDVRDIGDLVDAVETETLRAPWAQVTVTGTALLPELSAEKYTALTGEEPPAADGGTEQAATRIVPGDLKAFLVAGWASTDPEWQPATGAGRGTTISLGVGGNAERSLAHPREDETEHSGGVLMVVDASPQPADATVHVEVADGVQEISLIDGTITDTIAPRMYSDGLEVEVSEAGVLETEVPDGFAQDYMGVTGTIDTAYLTPFINSGVDHGGNLDWAREDEIFLVVPFEWDRDSTSNVKDLTEAVLVLPDGTEVAAEQDQSAMFGALGSFIATFTVPAELDSATVKIMPRYGQVLDEDFEQVEDPITATLTLL